MLLSELNGTRDEGVLRRTVDEGGLLEDASNGEDSGWGDFLVTRLDGVEQVVSGVIDAFDDVGIALSVGSPLYNDLIKTIVCLEVPARSVNTNGHGL
jgi:hypothetical protein